ncbi:hypothetical protein MLD38_020561 [Melastoma candidum]|uniref:Uncharacterized protein n=1 Tax=Melastoma candidum TaxID=119954 RepID=A0ACB9QE88_9MYRT|nr:hypothetical protein MLD38_020561 [Melastoma candidum]
MNLSNGKGSLSTLTNTGGSWKPADMVSDKFPAGLRVLVVDDDPTCLMILEKMLKTCQYEVTTCNRAEIALSNLRNNRNGFDVVLSDVHMPDMDGFKLLECIGLEMDLPVIMMSADDGKQVVMRGVTHGACDYLIKPIRIEALKNIWQHVVRKRKNGWKELEQSGSAEDGDCLLKHSEDVDYSSTGNEGTWKNVKRRKDDEDDAEERDDTSTLKKPRVVWSVELHQQFVAAVNQLGIDKAVPKKILELMNVPGLTRENVASHLQKYRLYLRRLSGVSQHPAGVNNPFISPQDAAFGPISSLNGLDLPAIVASGQLPTQSLATLQAPGFGRPSPKSGISMPVLDQRSMFSFDNPKIRFGEAQQPQQNVGGSKQMNLLHGIPTNMEPKQLASLQQSTQPFGNLNGQVVPQVASNSGSLVQMSQTQSRGQMLGESSGARAPRLPAAISQSPLPSQVASGVLVRNGTSENGRAAGQNHPPQTSSTASYSANNSLVGTSNSFPIITPASGLPSFTPNNGGFQDNVPSSVKVQQAAAIPSYDILNDLHKIRSCDWEFQSMGIPYNGSRQDNMLLGNIEASSSLLAHQGSSSSIQIRGPNRSGTVAGKTTVPPEGSHPVSARNFSQQFSSTGHGPVQVKVESFADPVSRSNDLLYQEHFGQEDLMSMLLKPQQQGIIRPADSEFEFDGYSVDNIPV